MAKYYQDFIGLNTFVYEISGYSTNTSSIDSTCFGDPIRTEKIDNLLGSGVELNAPLNHRGIFTQCGVSMPLINYKNIPFGYELADTASYFNALMSKRNGPYGYPMWKQIRTSHNPLSRKQRRENVFTYVTEPGTSRDVTIGGRTNQITDRYGAINVFTEPVVNASHKPLELYGGVSVYDSTKDEEIKHSVRLKTSFGSQMMFFANDEPNRYYELVFETDENYENLKKLYLNDALASDSSPMDRFSFLSYKQQIWPKQEFAFLDKTRSRTFFVNTSWRDVRSNRAESETSNGFGITVPSQSMWPLDVQQDWATRSIASASTNFNSIFAYGYYVGGSRGGSILVSGVSAVGIGGYDTGKQTGTSATVFNTALSASAGGAGILMNSYSQIARGQYAADGTPSIYEVSPTPTRHQFLTSSAFYSRRHTLNTIQSVSPQTGMDIAETAGKTAIATGSLFEGLAAWDAAKQHGSGPSYDSYEEFNQNIRLKGQGYSIVPEFRISSHVNTYETKGVTEELKEIFELSGALEQNTTTSGSSTFYKVLSNSEFLKHFDLIKKDHEDFANPISLALRCKAVKKFLPYEGFYPAERATQMSQQFYSSYSNNIQLFQTGTIAEGSQPFAVQPLIEPLFAPGALFNTIKAGVACDYPVLFAKDGGAGAIEVGSFDVTLGDSEDKINFVITGSSLCTGSAHDKEFNNQLNSVFSKRIPFEALVEPETFLAQDEYSIQEPHPFGLQGEELTAIWAGDGDNLYKKLANNFLAEVPEFFLKDSNFTTLASLESQNPSFGNAEAGKYYMMRIKMYKSTDSLKDQYPANTTNAPADFLVIPPQDENAIGGARENFTMYSRPSAFGVPSLGNECIIGSRTFQRPDSFSGSNYPFTPPYYNGEAWCDVIFRPTESRKYSLDEILTNVSKYPYFTRHWTPENSTIRDLTGYEGFHFATGAYSEYSGSDNVWRELILSVLGNTVITSSSGRSNSNLGATGFYNYASRVFSVPKPPVVSAPQNSYYINYNAMQLNSSVNLFSKGEIRVQNVGEETIDVTTDVTNNRKARWIIQPKFETPMLNFNSYSSLEDSALTIPTFASESSARGMWHQKGVIETDPAKGIFLQVTDLPSDWMTGQLGIRRTEQDTYVRSLADLCGFSKEPVRLGEAPLVKEISEAVVAVPFLEQDGTRKFFSIARRDIDEALDGIRREVEPGVFVTGGDPKTGKSIVDMVRNMKKYVFPPSMDFVKYNEIDPFAMYVFEFKHNLTREDVTNMWQNLPPQIGRSFEESEVTIGHSLVSEELLGGGAEIQAGEVRQNIQTNLDSKIQWMIFKAKKRAKTNYFDKVVDKKGTTADTSGIDLEGTTSGQLGDDTGITYNWPYDFFSLVELVKIDAEVNLGNLPPPVDNKIMQDIKADVPKSTRQKAVVQAAKPTPAASAGSTAASLLAGGTSGGSNSGGGSGPGFSGGGGIGF
jgi:hypothetical protein